MLILKNNAARLITINLLVGEQLNEYQILPGDNEPTKVPSAVKELDFVKALLGAGDLSIVDTIEDEEDNGLAALQEEAKALGVKVDGRWSEDRLREEIAKAKK